MEGTRRGIGLSFWYGWAFGMCTWVGWARADVFHVIWVTGAVAWWRWARADALQVSWEFEPFPVEVECYLNYAGSGPNNSL